MKFVKSKKAFTAQANNSLNFIKKNWNKISEEKKKEFVVGVWAGIIPTKLPLHLKPFEKMLRDTARLGSEGQAWDIIINETQNFIEDSKKMSKKALEKKYGRYLKRLHDEFYKNYDWQSKEEHEFNAAVQREIKEVNTQFFEDYIVEDLDNSKLKAWKRHCVKWNWNPGTEL
jgi:uncharacterized protein YaaW (UPF0174 family)